MRDRGALDAALLGAHEAQDRPRLIQLYAAAAEGQPEQAAGFYLTHAYVYALDLGDEVSARRLHQRLVAMGREA